MFDLNRLPYDILPFLLATLDRDTLLNVCLTSRALNELGSRVLYRVITIHSLRTTSRRFNQYRDHFDTLPQPWLAFSRRPELRNAVQEAYLGRTLEWQSVEYWESQGGREYWPRCAKELKAIPRLWKIYFTDYGHWRDREEQRIENKILFDIIGELHSLRCLSVSDMPYDWADKLEHIKEIVVLKAYHLQWVKDVKDMNKRVTGLNLTFPSQRWNRDSIRTTALRHFPAITHLTLNILRLVDLAELFDIFHETPDLRHIVLKCSISDDLQLPPTNLKKLKSLHITTQYLTSDSVLETRKLPEFLLSLSGKSRLETLFLRNTRDKNIEYSGRGWLPKMLKQHGKTLKRLDIEQVCPDLDTLRNIFGYQQLEELWIRLSERSRIELPHLVEKSTNLHTLRLVPHWDIGLWNIGDTITLLLQTSCSLNEVKIYNCGRERNRMFKMIWKAEWYYDLVTQKATRRIQGPLDVDLPTWRRLGDIKRRRYSPERPFYDEDFQYDRYSDLEDC